MRYYSIDTENGPVQLPSVTTILDVTMPLEDKWRLEAGKLKNVPRTLKKRDQGRDRGQYCHTYMCRKLAGLPMGHGCYGSWLRRLDPWLRAIAAHNPSPLTERLVFSLQHGFAGTFDALVQLPNLDGYTLLDLKTCAYKAWPLAIREAQLQCAAYALALSEQQWIFRASRIATLHLSPYALQVEIVEGTELDALQANFLERLHLFGTRRTELQS
jgi:hypothetical protein